MRKWVGSDMHQLNAPVWAQSWKGTEFTYINQIIPTKGSRVNPRFPLGILIWMEELILLEMG